MKKCAFPRLRLINKQANLLRHFVLDRNLSGKPIHLHLLRPVLQATCNDSEKNSTTTESQRHSAKPTVGSISSARELDIWRRSIWARRASCDERYSRQINVEIRQCLFNKLTLHDPLVDYNLGLRIARNCRVVAIDVVRLERRLSCQVLTDDRINCTGCFQREV